MEEASSPVWGALGHEGKLRVHSCFSQSLPPTHLGAPGDGVNSISGAETQGAGSQGREVNMW